MKAFKAYAAFKGIPLTLKQKPAWNPIRIPPTRSQLKEFYSALDEEYERLAIIGYAVTGLRRNALLDLKMHHMRREVRAIVLGGGSRTKGTHITFYNGEFEEHLERWIRLKKPSDRQRTALRSRKI